MERSRLVVAGRARRSADPAGRARSASSIDVPAAARDRGRSARGAARAERTTRSAERKAGHPFPHREDRHRHHLSEDGGAGRSRKGSSARAIERGLLDVRVHDLRDFTTDRHRRRRRHAVRRRAGHGAEAGAAVPRGRGDPRRRAERLDAVMLTSPDGRRFTHADAERLSALGHVVMLCGRYEGVDERVAASAGDREISIGDYVLSGGELPALVIVDAVARLVPGVVGDEAVGGARLVRARAAGLPAVHAAGGVPRPGGAAGAAVGAPRGDRAVAAARGARAHARARGRICWTSDAAGRRTIAGCCRNLLEQRTKEQS